MTDRITAHHRDWPLRRFRTTDSHGRAIDVFSLSPADKTEKEALDKEAVTNAIQPAID